jgi:hypothetical protein
VLCLFIDSSSGGKKKFYNYNEHQDPETVRKPSEQKLENKEKKTLVCAA